MMVVLVAQIFGEVVGTGVPSAADIRTARAYIKQHITAIFQVQQAGNPRYQAVVCPKRLPAQIYICYCKHKLLTV